MNIREFLVDIFLNEIVQGKEYSERIEIEGGGFNSYIGLWVNTTDFDRSVPISYCIRLFRHANSIEELANTWEFLLGDITHKLNENPGIPLRFSSYGKTPEEAEAEAVKCFKELRKLIRKRTAEYKKETAKSTEQERAELLARLAELEEVEP